MAAKTNADKATIDKVVGKILSSGKTLHFNLRTFSRDYWGYVYETMDIDPVNRLIAGIPSGSVYRKRLIDFSKTYLGWVWSEEEMRFKGKDKAARFDKKKAAIFKALEDEDFDIHTWHKAKRVSSGTSNKLDTSAKLTKFLKTAVSAKDDPLTPDKLVICLKEAGISVTDLLAALRKAK